jgi:uncharacterized protein (DUF3820 family)
VHNSEVLLELVKFKMPFGRYKGTILANLPVSYLEWFQRKGFPEGKLGMMLATMYEIKSNGLEYLLEPLRKLISVIYVPIK